MKKQQDSELIQRLNELESKQAFQEDALEELNKTVVKHQQEIIKLREIIKIINNKLQNGQSPIASISEETPPPHY